MNTNKEYMKGLVYPIYCLRSHIGYGIDMNAISSLYWQL
jgi:hypothetical protein